MSLRSCQAGTVLCSWHHLDRLGGRSNPGRCVAQLRRCHPETNLCRVRLQNHRIQAPSAPSRLPYLPFPSLVGFHSSHQVRAPATIRHCFRG
ncbi:hypothetical protein LINGRAHAP2_LOCUS23882 [Linum grandiflorum]